MSGYAGIEARNVNYIYNEGIPGETRALNDVSFRIESGELVGIIGHTGSGKSTLLQILDGLLKPASGSVIIGGRDITDPKESMVSVRRRVGLVFQYPEYQLFEETVHKDVSFGPLNLGLSQEEADERVREAIELVGLDYDEVSQLSPFELSGGQRRRVAIAGVIAMKPQVLILDEPTAGLNPKAHDDILGMVRTIHQVENNIIIMVSHNMDDIAAMADHVMVMQGGSIVMDGNPEDVFSRRAELQSMGLDVPAATSILGRLKDSGMDIDDRCLTLDEAADRIAEVMA
ncbi:MAG: energy-coupling factor transporter ATPase [Firmicutes bacterium]|nr:energy-coupling factor transporter ATPase [Bacillota bacterium]